MLLSIFVPPTFPDNSGYALLRANTQVCRYVSAPVGFKMQVLCTGLSPLNLLQGQFAMKIGTTIARK